MRDILKQLNEEDYWCYGVSESDFDYTFDLVKKLHLLSDNRIKIESEKIQLKYSDPEICCEIVSDISHYAWCEKQYLWYFCLWRIQGIFEALILYSFIQEKPKKPLIGLKSKLNYLIESQYIIEEEDYKELIQWGKLRNALSHAPPEQYRPGPLTEADVVEYIKFVKNICKKLNKQKSKLNCFGNQA